MLLIVSTMLHITQILLTILGTLLDASLLRLLFDPHFMEGVTLNSLNSRK